MGFTEVYRFPGRDSSPLLIPVDIGTSDVIIDFGEPLMPSWLVTGTVFCISTLPDGREVSSPGVKMTFGSTRLNLSPPNFPYRVKFVPRRGLQYYNLVLSVGSSLSVNSVDTLYLNDSEKTLLSDFGLNQDISALSPQNATLLLFLLKSLKETEMRNSTDILTFVGKLDAVIRQSEQTETALENQDVLLTSVISKAVVVKDFVVQKAAFVLGADNLWACDVVHDMRSMSPIAAVYDNGTDGLGRDLQLVQVTSKDENRSTIRMTTDQYNDADFPFHCKFSDRSQIALTSGSWKLIPTGDKYFRLLNGFVDRSADGINVEVPELLSTIVEAFMIPVGQNVIWKNQGGQTGYIQNGNLGAGPSLLSQQDYESFKSQAGTVAL